MLTEWRDWIHFAFGGVFIGFLVWAKYMVRIDELEAKARGLEEFIETNAPKWGVDR